MYIQDENNLILKKDYVSEIYEKEKHISEPNISTTLKYL